jgi:hypothetical protein
MMHSIGCDIIETLVLGKELVAGPHAIDVSMSLRGAECELIWANTDDISIALVKRHDIKMLIATEDRELRWDLGDGPQLWAWKTREWRPEEVVDDAVKTPTKSKFLDKINIILLKLSKKI